MTDDVECPECESSENVDGYHLGPDNVMRMKCSEHGILSIYGWVRDDTEG